MESMPFRSSTPGLPFSTFSRTRPVFLFFVLAFTFTLLWSLPSVSAFGDDGAEDRVHEEELRAHQAVGFLEPDGRLPRADVLLLSNSPETVRRSGVLFRHDLEPGITYRLFLHHLNGTGFPADLTVSLAARPTDGNSGDASARARIVIGGIAQSPSPVTSGWQAAQAYGSAEPEAVLDVQVPRRKTDVLTRSLEAGDVLTAYAHIRVEQPVQLQVRLGADDAILEPDGVHMRGVIADPHIDEDVDFSLRERILEIFFGASGSFRDEINGDVLRGDWGIDHRWNVSVHNPFDVPMPLHLLFIPRGGDGRLLVRVDDELLTTPRTFSGHYFLVRRWVIYPNQTRKLSLWTTPVSAMGYPAVLRLSTSLDPGWPRHPTSPER